MDALNAQAGVVRIERAYIDVLDRTLADALGVDRWFMVYVSKGVDILDLVARYTADPAVEAASPDWVAFKAVVPNDPMHSIHWGHNNTAQMKNYCWNCGGHDFGTPVGTVGFDADAQPAWDQPQGYGSASVIIAILDTGVDIDHPDLRLVAGYDFGDNDSNPDDDSFDPGHGTACAGVAAAKANNGLGTAGAAGGCSVMPLKVADITGSLQFSYIQNALYHAANNGADVASMSFGANISSDPATDTAINYAYNAGVVLLAATGNENRTTISYPANHANVIGIGAASPCGQRKRSSSNTSELNPGVFPDPNSYTCDGERWWGSNYGTTTQNAAGAVDVIAPTILPTTDIGGAGGYDPTDYSKWFNGTSCSTPYAAGVCALIISRNPTFTPAQTKARLTASAVDVTSVESGTGWDRYAGFGMVNALGAVTNPPPSTPVLTQPANGAAVPGPGVTMTWTSSPSVTHNLQVATNSSFTTLVVSVTTSATSYTWPCATPGNVYYWRVRACSGANCSGYSAHRTFTVQSMPAAPTLVSPANGAVVPGPNVTVIWNDPCGPDLPLEKLADAGPGSLPETFAPQPYRLEFATNPGFNPLYYNTDLSTTSYTLVNPPAGLYYWRVKRCEGATLCTAYSAVRTFTMPLVLLAPIGGENWPPGSVQTVQWQGGGTVKIELFADVTSAGASLTGPFTVLTTSATGGSYNITLPPDLATRRARIQISRPTGTPMHSYSANPFTVATAPPPNVWSYDAVDTPNHGWNQSDMCRNGGNGVEAVYFDYLSGQDLRHASKLDKTAEWVPSIAQSSGNVGSWPSIARGSDGTLHVAYYDHTLQNAILYYTQRPAGGQWSTPYPVAPITVVQGDCSIALQNGVPFIAFNSGNYAGMQLKVFKRNANGTWSPFGATIPATIPHHITLRSEPFGTRFWLSFIDQSGTRMNLWIYNGVNWLAFPVTFATGPYTTAEVTLDQFLNPQLAYTVPGTAPGSQKLLFQPWAEQGSGFDVPRTIDQSLGTISSLSLSYGPQLPNIGYVGNGVAKLATGVYSEIEWPCAWNPAEVVDATGNMDSQASLVVTPSNEKWLMYRDLVTQSMRAARPYWVDTVPPAASPWLNASGGCDSIFVDWQATGDDGMIGIATSFDLRWSAGPISNDTAFNNASAVPVALPVPGPAGTPHRVAVYMGPCSQHMYFGLKIRDNANNLSPLTSHVGGAQTACVQPPAMCWDAKATRPEEIPSLTTISGTRPNPTSRSLEVELALARTEVGGAFDLAVYDVAGRRVATLRDMNPGAGRHLVRWNLRDQHGVDVSAGIYFLRMKVATRTLTQRVVVVR